MAHCELSYKELVDLFSIYLQIAFSDYSIQKYSFFRKKLMGQMPNFEAKFDKRPTEFMGEVDTIFANPRC